MEGFLWRKVHHFKGPMWENKNKVVCFYQPVNENPFILFVCSTFQSVFADPQLRKASLCEVTKGSFRSKLIFKQSRALFVAISVIFVKKMIFNCRC